MTAMSASPWTFHNPVKVVFEPQGLRRIAGHIAFERVALVTSPGFVRRGLVAEIEAALGERLVAIIDDVAPNPALTAVEAQGDRLRPTAPQALIALGGGSTIDSAKALARLLTRPAGTPLADLFAADQLPAPAALPLIAIPTTSGTGAEVTPFGTVWDYHAHKKRSVVGDDLYPRLALLDPELTLGLPEDVTISSGLDAISHALESAWNRNANPASLGLVTKSLQLSLSALPRAVQEPENRDARADMMQASTLAGIAISQTRTALAHAISYPLTARFGLPHGLACSFTLPALLAFNSAVDDGRLASLARSLGYAGTRELGASLTDLFEQLEIRERLAAHLPSRTEISALSSEMFTPGRAENNLREAAEENVRAIVSEALATLRL